MQYESTGVHGVRRSISIDISQVARGLTKFYYKGQFSIFFEDDINSVRIKVHKTMLDAMLTPSNFGIVSHFVQPKHKNHGRYKGPELTFMAPCRKNKIPTFMILKINFFLDFSIIKEA